MGSNRDDHRGWFGSRHLPLETETCVFILINSLDVFLTFALLYVGGFRESNEIANQILQRWGITGLVYFKFSLVAIVTVVTQLVASKNANVARYLLNAGSILVSGVVLYSLYLLVRYSGLF